VNIVSGGRTFREVDSGHSASAPFFDIEDEDFVRIDLWRIRSAAISLMDLFYGVARDVASATGRSLIGFRADFQRTISGLAAESNALLDELKGSDRFKAAMLKMEQGQRQSEKPNRRAYDPHRHHRSRLRGDQGHAPGRLSGLRAAKDCQGGYFIWVQRSWLNKLEALRRPGEGLSETTSAWLRWRQAGVRAAELFGAKPRSPPRGA
jgi:hypothetical protein